MIIFNGSPSHSTICTWQKDQVYLAKCCSMTLQHTASTQKYLLNTKKKAESNLLQEFQLSLLLQVTSGFIPLATAVLLKYIRPVQLKHIFLQYQLAYRRLVNRRTVSI